MHFFTEQDLSHASSVTLKGDDAHHLIHVLRARCGEQAELSDACGRTYLCTVESLTGGEVRFAVGGKIEGDRELPASVTLYQSIVKGDKMDLIIQKAVELGTARIVPVITGRTVARPDEKSARRKQERWQKIAASAAEQCGRARIPEVAPVCPFDEALLEAERADRFLFPYECASGMDQTRSVLTEIEAGSSVAVMIGPEGGFKLSEVEKARDAGACILTLGSRILRAETAALTALSWLVYQLEEM